MTELNLNVDERFAVHPADYKSYDAQTLRQHFLIDNVFQPNEIRWVYSHYDRMMVGGAFPTHSKVFLLPIDQQKSAHFLDRRELGVINVGGAGVVHVDGESFPLAYKESLYLGKNNKDVVFVSDSPSQPAKFYLLSTPAHQQYPNKKVGHENAEVIELGAAETCNARTLRKLLVDPIIQTCQLQMGMTELKSGSVWNTMPPHTHSRRMEVYFYFEVPADQAVCHFMGPKEETRHLWLSNEQAVLSPPWSMHCAAATSHYVFIWGMAGENLDYGDMDFCKPSELR